MADPKESQSPAPSGDREPLSPVSIIRAILQNYFVAIFGAAVLAFLLRVFVMEAFRIPTDLMAPMLLPGDHIFVNKLAYKGLVGLGKGDPQRGDIVIFTMPADPTKDYIKRVVAVAGDRVEIRDGAVVLNGKTISRATGPDNFDETVDGRTYSVQWTGAPAETRRMMEVTVPPGNVFVLGDHRAKGQDSRAWGFLPVKAIEGRASLIWFSTGAGNDGGTLGVRWSRIFTKVK